jgi:hypothetical protein
MKDRRMGKHERRRRIIEDDIIVIGVNRYCDIRVGDSGHSVRRED